MEVGNRCGGERVADRSDEEGDLRSFRRELLVVVPARVVRKAVSNRPPLQAHELDAPASVRVLAREERRADDVRERPEPRLPEQQGEARLIRTTSAPDSRRRGNARTSGAARIVAATTPEATLNHFCAFSSE
jgi:hypothetical protein